VAIFIATLHRYWPVPSEIPPCGIKIGFETLQLACSLAQKGSFSDPFMAMPTGLSAHVAPAFPFLVSLLIRVFGNTTAAIVALQWMAVLALAIQLTFWPLTTRQLGMGVATGVMAAAVWLTVRFTLFPMWEALYLELFSVVISFCMYRIVTGQASWWFVLLTAAAWGVTLLFNPVPFFVLVAFLVWTLFFTKLSRPQALMLVLIPCLIILPWLVRNAYVFRHFVLIRDNLGLELAIGNNPCAKFWFRANRFTSCYSHPNESIEEAEKVRRLGEYQYNKLKQREAMSWIRSSPREFLELTERRFLAFWLPTPTGNPFSDQQVPTTLRMFWVLTLLSIAGLWLLYRQDPIAAGVCLAWLTFFPPVYYFIQFDVRYRYPILWATFFPGCFFVVEIVRGIGQAFRKRDVAQSADYPEPRPDR
jgi:hypothetical protein